MPKHLPSRAQMELLASRTAFALCLLLPAFLLHARALADIGLVGIDLCFLLRSVLTRNLAWAATPFCLAALVWWLWLVLCSAAGTGGLLLALVAIRLPLLAPALASVLEVKARRRALWWVLAASAGWIALQAWEQYLTGSNLFGHGRYIDGALTGPFAKPRAGPALILIMFPVLVPAIAGLVARGGWRFAAAGLAAFAVVTMVLIGQRMPTALLALGLGLTGLLLPRLRSMVLAAAACGALLLAATPIISPGTYAKLVVQTRAQLTHFPQTRYGRIYARAADIARAHPMLGLGLDGFRRECAPVLIADPADMSCSTHPHNYLAEAVSSAGLPGLIAFVMMEAALILRLARRLDRDREGLRIGCLVGAIVAFWPTASTSAFGALPNAGWIFLTAGLGFASCKASGSEALSIRPATTTGTAEAPPGRR